VNYFVGLDLGKRQDATALAVVERRQRENAFIGPDRATNAETKRQQRFGRYTSNDRGLCK
jgi:hypothetical protein